MGKTSVYFAILIFALGVFFRFYKLDWGNGLYTHPDEYHIIGSVLQLSFPKQMNPHFFSYGTGVIYPVYFAYQLTSHFFPSASPFIVGRALSAFFSCLTLFIIYAIARIFLSERLSLLALFLATLNQGLIQQAHFATPESELIFFLLTAIFFALLFLRDRKLRNIVVASLFVGLGLSVKITALLFFPLIIAAVLGSFGKDKKQLFKTATACSVVTLVSFFLLAPYVFADYQAFKGSMDYEGGVAMGTFPVFYTTQFINTTPFLFQIESIFPYALGPAIELLGFVGLFLFLGQKEKKLEFQKCIFVLGFLLLYVPSSLLFVKWTRFIAPAFPFFIIFSAYCLDIFLRKQYIFSKILVTVIVIISVAQTVAFFSIYTHSDIRGQTPIGLSKIQMLLPVSLSRGVI